MAANRILVESKLFIEFAADSFKYNLQVLPDLILSASVLFSILFQSPPMAVFATAILSLGFLHGYFARFLSKVYPDLASYPDDTDRCSGRFPGVSYERLLGVIRGVRGNQPTMDAWPSYYTTFVGFLAGWIGALPAIYAQEIAASPKRASAVSGGIITLGILCLIVVLYRITSKCEGFASTTIGLLSGFLMGLGLVMFAAWISDRRATNILGMPLIRGKATDGKPIYVCERE